MLGIYQKVICSRYSSRVKKYSEIQFSLINKMNIKNMLFNEIQPSTSLFISKVSIDLLRRSLKKTIYALKVQNKLITKDIE